VRLWACEPWTYIWRTPMVGNEAVAALLRFNEVMTKAVEDSVRELAPPDDPVVSIDWTDGDPTLLAAILRSGRVIQGTGTARLEAVQDAYNRLHLPAT
jgi:hypothetical protein